MIVMSTLPTESYNFYGAISPNGSIYRAEGVGEHYELYKDLIKKGLLDISFNKSIRNLGYAGDIYEAALYNGYIHISAGRLLCGVDYEHPLKVKITNAQIKAIIHIATVYKMVDIDFNNLTISLPDFIQKIHKPNSEPGIAKTFDDTFRFLSIKEYGSKANMLSLLTGNSYLRSKIPSSIAIPRSYLKKGQKYNEILNNLSEGMYGPTYSVRSSPSMSMPGRMKSIHDVDKEGIILATEEVLNSYMSDPSKDYMEAVEEHEDMSGGILIMDYKKGSIPFTLYNRNPITGNNNPWADVFKGSGERAMDGQELGVFEKLKDHPSLPEFVKEESYRIVDDITEMLDLWSKCYRLEMGYVNDELFIYQFKVLDNLQAVSEEELLSEVKDIIVQGIPASSGVKELYLKEGGEGMTDEDLYVCEYVGHDTPFSYLRESGGLLTRIGSFSCHGSELSREISKNKTFPSIVSGNFDILEDGIQTLDGQFIEWGTKVKVIGGLGIVAKIT